MAGFDDSAEEGGALRRFEVGFLRTDLILATGRCSGSASSSSLLLSSLDSSSLDESSEVCACFRPGGPLRLRA